MNNYQNMYILQIITVKNVCTLETREWRDKSVWFHCLGPTNHRLQLSQIQHFNMTQLLDDWRYIRLGWSKCNSDWGLSTSSQHLQEVHLQCSKGGILVYRLIQLTWRAWLFTDRLVQELTLQGTEGSQVEHWRTGVGFPGATGTGSRHGGSHPLGNTQTCYVT